MAFGTIFARSVPAAGLCALLLAEGSQLLVFGAAVQNSAETPAKPLEHVLGTITAVDPAAHTVTVKDDKQAVEFVVSTANTRTLIKVLPGAKDLKGATRITAEDLSVGDRVDIRGFKDPASDDLAARSVVLMSARELQAKNQAESAAWQNSTSGTVTAVDPAARSLVMTSRTPAGPQTITVQVPVAAELTRYAPDNPKTPTPSQLTDIQPGDQVRVIGSKAADGSSLSAERVYSGAFRTIAGTIIALNPDGKSLTVKNLQTKQQMQITLGDTSAVHKLPPEMAALAARRMNGAGPAADRPPGATPSTEAASTGPASTPPSPEGMAAHPHQRGDLSQMVQRLPPIALTDLKSGDAVIVSGVLAGNKSQLVATSIVAGVEPILQSPTGRARQSEGLGDWSLDMAVPNQ